MNNPNNKPSKKKKSLSKKFYESDTNNDKGERRNPNLSDPMIEDKSDEDDEFLYYNYQR